jgi:hypothetical protein
MARPVRKLLLPLILWACVSLSPANADLIWGANGHPFNAYPGIPYERQLDLVRDLGMTSYRVDISSLEHIPRLARLIAAAKEREITILPLLTPPVSLEKDTPETLYQQARTFATKVISPFKDDIKVWELGNELENFAIIQPCEMQDDGVQYNCDWGPAGGVGPLEYYGPRWAKVSAVLKGLSDGAMSVDPTIRKAMGTAGWGHVGAFERMRQDGIEWDISVWHFYGEDPEWGFKRVAAFGKPIWVTEVNHPLGSQKGTVEQAAGLKQIMTRFRALQDQYRVEAAHIYELLDEPYWAPSFEAVMGLVYLDKDEKGKWKTSGRKPAYCVVKSLLRGGFRLAAASAPATPTQERSNIEQSSAQPHRQCNLCLFDNLDGSPANKVAYSYCLILGRQADGGGLEDWTAELKKDRPIGEVLLSLADAEEFKQKYSLSELSNSDYVMLIYRLLLDRDPDAQGHADYLAALDKGELGRPNLVKALIHSEEFRSHHAALFQPAAKAAPSQ